MLGHVVVRAMYDHVDGISSVVRDTKRDVHILLIRSPRNCCVFLVTRLVSILYRLE